MSANQKTLVFVYGTLRRGFSNHFRLGKAPFVKEGWILGRLYRIDWYPGMRLDEEGVPVRGEIYEIEREALRELDVFEGKEFERLKTKVHAKGGGDFHVWLYEYCREVDYGAELLPADWAHHERKNDRKVPAPLFSLATFILLPATAALGAFMTWSDPDSSSRILQTVSIVLPLLAFLAGRKAHARQERWAEGAEVCAAVAFIVFCLMLLIRFLPSAFEAFPN
ncbi:MAG: hypothetical protein CMP30_14025 [Roseibacillus sp.]|nr:hypothetical protein [Roseibacillus sp.]